MILRFIKDALVPALPLLLPLAFLISGTLFSLAGKRRRLQSSLLAAGLILLLLESNSCLTKELVSRLEHVYPLLSDEELTERNPPVEYVVVLSAYTFPHEPVSLTDKLSSAMLYRLIEGVRLHRQLPGTKLVLSGGPHQGAIEAEIIQEMALSLGVSADETVLEPRSASTREQAVNLTPLLKGKVFVLVTSARHMPRSVALFRKVGLNPIPAPTDYAVKGGSPSFSASSWLPNAGSLTLLSEFLYEKLGYLKAKAYGNL